MVSLKLIRVWNETQEYLLYPQNTYNPYYICAPPWLHTSAGIRALYLLCHTLNMRGFNAFIVDYPFEADNRFHSWTCDELFTPLLSERVANQHHNENRCPIVVYPEIVNGNPLSAQVVARWVMNFPGLLGGSRTYLRSEICFGYSKELAIACGYPDNILYLPTIDTRVFNPTTSNDISLRSGTCYFATKFKAFCNSPLHRITENSFEITRDLEDSLTPQEIAHLLKKSELFFTYENTALATEAVLCGCPAVFIPNPHLTSIIGREELGSDGYAWGTSEQEIKRARDTVIEGAINYFNTYKLFSSQLDNFIQITQQRACATKYESIIYNPYWKVRSQSCNNDNVAYLPINSGKPMGWEKHIIRPIKEVKRFFRKIKKFGSIRLNDKANNLPG